MLINAPELPSTQREMMKARGANYELRIRLNENGVMMHNTAILQNPEDTDSLASIRDEILVYSTASSWIKAHDEWTEWGDILEVNNLNHPGALR